MMVKIDTIPHIFFLRPFFPLVSLLFFPTAMMDRGSSRRGHSKPRSGANHFGRALTTYDHFSNMAEDFAFSAWFAISLISHIKCAILG